MSLQIEDLPNEVLTMICKEAIAIHDHHDIGISARNNVSGDGLALSLVSKTFNGIAERVLYADVCLWSPTVLLKFLRLMFQRPDLARCVKHIWLSGLDLYNQDRNEYQLVYDSTRVYIKQYLSTRGYSHEDALTLKHEVSKGCWHSIAALLLEHLTDISSGGFIPMLHPSYNQRVPQQSPVYRGISSTLSKLHVHEICPRHDTTFCLVNVGLLQHVKDLTLEHGHLHANSFERLESCLPATRFNLIVDEWTNPLAIRKIVSKLPSLQDFRLETTKKEDCPMTRMYPKFFGLGGGSINSTIRVLVDAKPRLTRLTLRFSPMCSLAFHRQTQTWDTVTESLASLQQLKEIDIPAFDTWVYHPEDIANLDLNLNKWTHHRHYNIELQYKPVPVLGSHLDTYHGYLTPIAEVLPQSTERLTLRNAGRTTMFHAWDFIASKRWGFSNFKKLNIEFIHDYTEVTCEFPRGRKAPRMDDDIRQLTQHGLCFGVAVSCECRTYNKDIPYGEYKN